MLNDSELMRIAEAVRAAEATTSGEVFCLVAEEVSDYPEVPLAYAAAASLLLPPLAAATGLFGRLLESLQGWTAGQGGADPRVVTAALAAYGLMQALVFAAAWGLVAVPHVRRALTPGWLKTHKVRRLATQLFVATGMKDDPARTGVLIFAAFAERRVEILADAAIHQAAPAGAWDQAVAAVTEGMRANRCAEGFERAIALCGEPLAAAFPGGAGERNRLGDRPLEV